MSLGDFVILETGHDLPESRRISSKIPLLRVPSRCLFGGFFAEPVSAQRILRSATKRLITLPARCLGAASIVTVLFLILASTSAYRATL